MKSFAILALAAVPAFAQTFCRLPTGAVSGAPAGAANIDGVCSSVNACFSVSGTRAFSGVCGGNSVCCIKNNCNGNPSACVIPNAGGNPLPGGVSGGFVSGACPSGLRCFRINANAAGLALVDGKELEEVQAPAPVAKEFKP